MFASSFESRARRRGIVLVLILGMLGLMALIGVTFATFAGQSLISGRNFAQGVARPQPETLMDYALAQLINDTRNPVSAIRGHSLLRDMYGNDSVFRGADPTINPAVETGGLLTSISLPAGSQSLHFTGLAPRTASVTSPSPTPFFNQIQFVTNIPTGGQYYGLDFTRWIVRFNGTPANSGTNTTNNVPVNGNAAQTFEVLEDDASSGPYHKFTLSNNLANPTVDPFHNNGNPPPQVPSDWATFDYVDANYMNPNGVVMNAGPPATYSFARAWSSLSREWNFNSSFVLDGRYMRAFNGPGMTRTDFVGLPVNSNTGLYPYNMAAYANYRINGSLLGGQTTFSAVPGDPDVIGMDEDYDACDLENWFLAIQSADGQVVIPSFHRPGILTGPSLGALNDWTVNSPIYNPNGPWGNPKILRPRQADNSPLFPADPNVPDSVTGKLTYDIDNDGDGVTDSVWVDLGYPVQRDPGGKLYKPLFAFMVLGLNGRLPLNTVGNLQARANADTTNNANVFATAPVPNATGQVPQPGIAGDQNNTYYKSMVTNAFFGPTFVSSQTYKDAPTWDHASHLGYSVNEINPKFALQNAPSNVFNSATSLPSNGGLPIPPNVNGNNFSQVDDAGVSVALTQLRNILAGTVPTDLPYPLPLSTGLPLNGNATITQKELNGDVNVVIVDGLAWVLPNNMADLHDLNPNSQPSPYSVTRLLPAVPGRWGETFGVQAFNVLPAAGTGAFSNMGINNPSFPGLIYSNPVRAGRSVYTGGSNDIMDDDFDATDPVLASPLSLQSYLNATYYYVEPGSGAAVTSIMLSAPGRGLPESLDAFDTVGQRAVASERIRQFVTPVNPGGVGRIVDHMNRPNNDYDYGNGYDSKGRAGYFRYFRPPGMPQEIRYPYGGANSSYSYPYDTYTAGSPGALFTSQRFLMPQLFPSGQSTAATQLTTGASDIHNNRYHGYQSMLTPEIAGSLTPQTVASMGGMTYDWDNSLNTNAGDVPGGYPNSAAATLTPPLPGRPPLDPGGTWVNNFAPTINPYAPQPAPTQQYNPNSILTSVNTSSGPNLGIDGNPQAAAPKAPIAYGNYQSATDKQPYGSPVVNGYLGGSLNKDEADEMNLYTPNRFDMPYGPTDLEWLYRLQDVDGATLTSRLSKLAPVSFLNPADGLTRRRLFSTDSWELNSFVYANDNPFPYAGAAYLLSNGQSATTDHDFTFNSRFMPTASPSLEIMNQIQANGIQSFTGNLANPITTEYLPNPTFPGISPSLGTGIESLVPNSASGTLSLPTVLNTSTMNPLPLGLFDKPQITPVSTRYGVVVPSGANSMVQVQTPSLSHRDRKINLNMPLPISHDPAEPVRQKWCRETYQLLKAILPPASVDTPEELAALSQFVVNIIDFRDPDCAMTRFVNTDLIVTDALTKSASNVQPATTTPPTPPNFGYDTTWNVSPPGVRFATPTDNGNLTTTFTVNGNPVTVTHFPYDPSLYNPDTTTPFLVQHGMEYNPIAITEVLGFQYTYDPVAKTQNKGLFIELVNTLTEEQNNNASNNNSSAISLAGWDLIVAPDNYGWGRPDPISGDVSSIAYPPLIAPAAPATVATLPAANTAAGSPLTQVLPFAIPPGSKTLKAINNNAAQYYVIGGTTQALATSINTPPTVDLTLPAASPILANIGKTSVASGKGQYFWVYLRRPANPFDTTPLQPDSSKPNYRPNREMVVVDAMRFPFIDATNGSPSPNDIYSAHRLQPYRGGHLVRVDTTAGTKATTRADGTTNSTANGVTIICPPSPASAYGYSEQMSPITTASGMFGKSSTGTKNTAGFKQSLGSAGSLVDSHWAHLPFLDRDFTSVAELLQVPGCPPGLFTKQFVEEPYPGNIAAEKVVTVKTTPTMQGPVTYSTTVTYGAPYATGSDDRDFATPIVAPMVYTAGTPAPPTIPTSVVSGTTSTTTSTTAPVGGRVDFNKLLANGVNSTPVAPTFPYLPDNFYYTAASVAPPPKGQNGFPASYTLLTTEIGGWTGNGWHKMMEFFEVPSSANGAVGTADGGNNFDWARADVKPGLLNLNLLIDEEVFAGLFDDPRLNERLARYVSGLGSSALPQIVTQIDANGYATGHYPISNLQSINQLNLPYDSGYYQNQTNTNIYGPGPNYLPPPPDLAAGRGYVVRDPDSQNYAQIATVPPIFPYQQLHGLKAAFSDFLKLRHGGSGFLFAYGAGPTGSGDVFHGGAWPQTQPIAAERPYRSMSYPDINYTVMRPASLPPSHIDDTILPKFRFSATTPPLPPALSGLFGYANNVLSDMNAYIQLSPNSAPRNTSATSTPTGTPFQYVADPGVKNPFLPIQYNSANPTTYTDPAITPPYVGPPFAVQPPSTTAQAAPFPPPIPPTPARRLIQVPDIDTSVPLSATNTSAQALAPAYPSSNASLSGSVDGTGTAFDYSVNQQVTTLMASSGQTNPPTLVPQTRAVFLQDNNTPQASTTYAPQTAPMATPPIPAAVNNYLGAGRAPAASGLPPATDYRQHPLYRSEWLQKVMNLTTVRTHQFAVWITVGFFEVVRPGTPELGIPDILGQELGLTAGKNVRYRSFFTLDRTRATGFNPYYPGDFRSVVTYRRRIE